MPNIVCRACGREVYTTVALDMLFAEERRCPRCGAGLFPDRRLPERRRVAVRRSNPAEDPGPPATTGERRDGERREGRRRHDDGTVGRA